MRRARNLRAALIIATTGTVMAAVMAGAAAAPSSAEEPAAPRGNHTISASTPSNGRAMIPRLHEERQVDPAGLARGKAEAEAWAARQQPGAAAAAGTAAPTANRSWQGLAQPNSQPSDSTGAVSPTRYVELINTDAAIYSRTSSSPLAKGSLLDLTGCADPWCFDDVFDPQIIWDSQTKRFYYAADDVIDSASDNRLSFGFSRTASPKTLGEDDWCKYNISYGADFPDYPKLGDSKDFAIIGVNTFGPSSFIGSDLMAVSKPSSGTSCPDASTFHFGLTSNLVQPDGQQAFTPVPANQTDADSTGWAVARQGSFPSSGGTTLDLFKVKKNSSGDPVIPRKAVTVKVPAYQIPPNVPQPGASSKLDSSDTRPTQAVSAIDPAHGGKVGLWTQHTVKGGAGSVVAWYEIDPFNRVLLQSGQIKDSTKYVFNGAVSPDRLVNGSTKKFGGTLVAGYNMGSSSAKVGVYAASKTATGTLSAPLLLKASDSIDNGFGSGCSGDCRWGDYASATPDPGASSTGSTGAVWLTSMYNGPNNSSGANWRTWNAAIKP